MQYLEVVFSSSSADTQELLVALLEDMGFDSFQQEDSALKAYIIPENYKETDIKTLLAEYPGLAEITFSSSPLPDINWNEEWEKNYPSVEVSDELIIRASFHEKPENVKHNIIINPKMSFGTGHHATTAMMAQQMLKMDLSGKNVLDFGCGSGVLAILAHKLGATPVVAIDNDEWAFNNSLENITLNNTANIQVILGDETNFPSDQYDVILANVNKNVILKSIELFSLNLKTGGTLLLSGLLEEDEKEVVEAGKKLALSYQGKLVKSGWICVNLRKN